ncbi:hypothetical protein [Pedobacter polysacchareus]|uniref:hypothetical protein n=1 Tax=Pedobacter polysacchareus TaxID=2861973 RepID=UPI001C9A2471|nr:hypothetical protein [Pedobacter polysacchareus]
MEFKNPRQGSEYDKIFKENMEANLEGIVEQVLSMKIFITEELPDDLQHTKERKPDLLKKVRDEDGQVFILHIEYQRSNDQNMAYRMAEYSIMLQRKYRLPVNQYMIYLGQEKLNMPTEIERTNFKFKYEVRAISTIDYRLFLYHEVIEMKLLAVLADLSAVDPKEILRELILEITEIVAEELVLGKYMNQLKIFAQLRDLEQTLKEVMEEVSSWYVKERDPYYIIGRDEGVTLERTRSKLSIARKLEEERTRSKLSIARKLEKERTRSKLSIARKMKKEGLTIPLIAKITDLSREEILNIKL